MNDQRVQIDPYIPALSQVENHNKIIMALKLPFIILFTFFILFPDSPPRSLRSQISSIFYILPSTKITLYGEHCGTMTSLPFQQSPLDAHSPQNFQIKMKKTKLLYST